MASFKYKILTVFLLVFSINGYAGTIKGNISDKSSGDPLTGAIVMLHGTKYGTATGLDGSYIIRDVPAGEYDLEVMYTSFETYKEHIKISADQTLTVNKLMEPRYSALKEVEVKAKLKNGSDEQARNIEKNSDQTLNIMSARTIELLPDITIANVLQRVSGIQMQRDASGDARYATIRGMDRRYNYTEVDGVVIPSPNDAGRYVPLDIFPAEIVDRIEVYKTLTPDMEANAIGGATNLVMKKAPDHLVIYASVATGYNQNLFDEHFNSFDKSAIVAKDPTRLYGPAYTATMADFSNLGISAIKPVQAPPNGLYSLSIGNRFLKDKKLGVMFSGSYQNTYKESNDIFFSPASEPAIGNSSLFDDLELRKYSTQDTRSAAHVNADYHINDKNTITLYGLYTVLDEWQERQVIDTVITAVNRPGPGLGTVDYKDRTTFTKEHIGNITLRGDHILATGLKLDWTGAYSKAIRDVPDYTESTSEDQFSRDSTGGIKEQGRDLKSLSKTWERTNDQDLQGMLNLTYNTGIFGKSVEFKAGGMYRAKDRDNYYNEYDFTVKSTRIPYSPQSATDTANWGFIPKSAGLGDAYGNGQTYNEHEDISAYYAQAKVLFFNNKLEVLGGVRIEHTFVTDSVYRDPKLIAGVSGTYNYTDVLPGLHLKYKLSKKENLRLSYYESIARPQYSELLNNSTPTETFTLYGNPYLNHSIAQNFDARYELFPKGLDQVLVGAFYKIIQDPIEYATFSTGTSAQGIHPVNDSTNAINYGAEIVVTKYFHYFGISGNYTYTHSAITVPESYLGVNPQHTTQQETYNVTETRPLQGQAAHIGNLALLYKNPVVGFNANLTLQYTGRYISLASQWQGLDYWQKATTFLDFACDQRIVKHLYVYLKVQNILNSKTITEINESNKTFTNPADPSNYFNYQNLKDGKILVQQTQTGRNYLIGIRFKLD